jgi:hypothetical protein
MRRRFLFIVIPLFALLAAAATLAVRMWTGISGGPGMDGHGEAALIIGAAGSLILGCGLMALVFFSSRRGYDDRASAARKLPREGE